jgi:hypothetical protein
MADDLKGLMMICRFEFWYSDDAQSLLDCCVTVLYEQVELGTTEVRDATDAST